MSWEMIKTPAGYQLVNWVAVQQIIRNFLRSGAMLKHSKLVADIKWLGPDLYSIDTDWEKVRESVNSEAPKLTQQIRMNIFASADSADTSYALASYRAAARKNEEEFNNLVKQAQGKTAAAIDSSVGRGEIALEVAKFVRDTSAEVLMIGASVATGGTAGTVFLFVAGPALKAGAKYQDTGNAKSAGIEFTVSLASNFVGKGIGKAAGESALKNIGYNIIATNVTNLGSDTAKAWVEGQSLADAAKGVAIKSTGTMASEPGKFALEQALKDGAMKSKTGLAVATTLAVVTTIIDRASAAATANPPANPLPVPANTILLDAVSFDDAFVRNFCWVPLTGRLAN